MEGQGISGNLQRMCGNNLSSKGSRVGLMTMSGQKDNKKDVPMKVKPEQKWSIKGLRKV